MVFAERRGEVKLSRVFCRMPVGVSIAVLQREGHIDDVVIVSLRLG